MNYDGSRHVEGAVPAAARHTSGDAAAV